VDLRWWPGGKPGKGRNGLTRTGMLAMPRFGIPRLESDEQVNKAMQVNWRRGLLRIWLLVSAAWIMGWAVYLILYGIQGGFRNSGDFLAIPVLLFGPPIALLLFGLVAGWAFRGFKPE
jgi:hypothetical protein